MLYITLRMRVLSYVLRCRKEEMLVRNLKCIVRLLSTEINFRQKEREPLSHRNRFGRRLWSERPKETDPTSPFDDLGSWHSSKPKSVLQNLSCESIGHYSSLGYREVNEDRVKIIELGQDLYYIAVFDGHGGNIAVDFVSEKLHKYVLFLQRKTTDLEVILKHAFEMCNDALAKYCKRMMDIKGIYYNFVCLFLILSYVTHFTLTYVFSFT